MTTDPGADEKRPRGSLQWLDRTEEFVAVGMLAALGVLLGAQVLLRFVFGLGYGWMEEISRMLFIWVIFLGAVVAMRTNLHIRVEAGLMLFPARWRPALAWVGDLLLFAFCIAMAWYGAELVASTLEMEFRLTSTGLSMFWPYLIIPISFGLQALRLALWRFGLRGAA
jgi:TRAP-type C4-dicarboxylate transport system permease small subunit